MPTISFRIEDDLKERIDGLVDRMGLNVSALFRQALADKVEELEAGDEKAQLRLSLKERLGLVLQFRTLAELAKLGNNESEEEDCRRQIELLSSGYELHYRDLVGWFSTGFAARWSKEVIDILSMFADLNWAFDNFTPEQQAAIDHHAITFVGFDGNNETRQMGYARFYLFDMNNFQSLHQQAKATDVNSHCQMLPTYRRMLSVFRTLEVPGGYDPADHRLTVEQVSAVVTARYGAI